jgi:hypothetical protein
MWHMDEPQNRYLNIDCQKGKWEMVATVWQRTTHDNFYIVTNCCLIGDVTSCFYLEGAYVHSINMILYLSPVLRANCVFLSPRTASGQSEKRNVFKISYGRRYSNSTLRLKL